MALPFTATGSGGATFAVPGLDVLAQWAAGTGTVIPTGFYKFQGTVTISNSITGTVTIAETLAGTVTIRNVL